MTHSQRDPRFSGYNLYAEEFFKQHVQKQKAKGKGKGKKAIGADQRTYNDLSLQMRESWKKLSSTEKGEYTKRAQQLRGPSKVEKYIVPFLTRCAPNTFIHVCHKLKERPEAMARLKAIGFDRLVEISCRQINRSLITQYMACFDPPTKQVSIRGETRVIGSEHVHQLMGLPVGGKGIEVKVSVQNTVFRDFRRAYKNVKYKALSDSLLGKLDENFEYIFVLFSLGILLAPSASIYISDRMLKVITLTKGALGHFDWSSFILQELTQQIHEFKKDSHKSKVNKSKTVGGCVYFLMVSCI